MRTTARMEGLRPALGGGLARIEKAITGAMGDATGGLKGSLRAQVIAAGLGARLAKTWQGNVYPRSGTSLEPAGYVYSKAPKIIAAFAHGGTIFPRLMNFLAVPTDNVPKRRFQRRMSPREVEREFGELQIRPGRNGTYLGFVDVVQGKNKRRPGLRRATPGRLAQGREPQLTLMFVFVRRTRMPRLLDLEAEAQRWGSQVPRFFDARMGIQ